jgi:hypothetical protein
MPAPVGMLRWIRSRVARIKFMGACLDYKAGTDNGRDIETNLR